MTCHCLKGPCQRARSFTHLYRMFIPPKTDMSPKKGLFQYYFNRKYIFQPLIFRGHVRFRESIPNTADVTFNYSTNASGWESTSKAILPYSTRPTLQTQIPDIQPRDVLLVIWEMWNNHQEIWVYLQQEKHRIREMTWKLFDFSRAPATFRDWTIRERTKPTQNCAKAFSWGVEQILLVTTTVSS